MKMNALTLCVGVFFFNRSMTLVYSCQDLNEEVNPTKPVENVFGTRSEKCE